MTKKEAILKSIKHWEKNVRKLQKGENLSFDDLCAEECPLCLKYASFKGFSMECGKCPLAKIDCCNSPDSTWREVKEKVSKADADAVKAKLEEAGASVEVK